MAHDAYDDDDKPDRRKAHRWREFDCPSCNANNPSEGFADGDELHCNYCGTQYLVRINDEGKLKLKEL